MYERYVELLNEKGVKNIDVSRATGIPASTFSDWKKGKSSPKREKLEKRRDKLIKETSLEQDSEKKRKLGEELNEIILKLVKIK